MRDISFEVMAKYLVRISAAITDARKDLVEHGMTGINSDMYSYLKKAQNHVDVLRHAIQPSQYVTVSGDVAHGYTLAGYKVGQNYYGHGDFGHTNCAEEGQKRVSIPLEEFEKFVHDIPFDSRCAACGRKVLLLAVEQSEQRIVESDGTETPEMLLGLHVVPNNQERSGEDDLEEQIDLVNWTEEQRLQSATFDAQLTEDA
jgi:hypothetical protein